ncbi:phosphotransferase [Algoriphagus zhangzhouensis]|uniref:5-methylthioribose kinase n=1 Tax=Algoriphagus zhangzhouensis TaxID=1073327 RepID=A0A1M7Z3K5_9BACT|nr:phosphotransferase [Algoriphagus zhangzhouensis]TDY48470.1 5-methylthioribose kinase [Algoriphagus zhangzhouensis]SHO59518.1 5-methylthioribose kinase [Algoriphagus zhangzhouensis]
MQLTYESLPEDLFQLDIWNPEESIISIAPAGESNMNVVLRVKTNQRSIILKQSKPYVRKFPQIPAPIDRIDVEFNFYYIINSNKFLAAYSPEILKYCITDHTLVTQDLGDEGDFSGLYSQSRELTSDQLMDLVTYLDTLHKLPISTFPENMEMRKLNHEHVFHFPFMEENGFDLDTIQSGLQELSFDWKKDSKLKQEIEKLGNRYLSTGNTLLHGDFYPGSWISSSGEIRVIDPEFSFLGDAEFDLGVFLAHGDFCGMTESFENAIELNYYKSFDARLANQYRGVELLRRLIGIAQLPLNLSLEKKKALMEKARKFILS